MNRSTSDGVRALRGKGTGRGFHGMVLTSAPVNLLVCVCVWVGDQWLGSRVGKEEADADVRLKKSLESFPRAGI